MWIKGTVSSRLARISQRTTQRPSTLLSYQDELFIEIAILLKGDRILIPKSMQTKTLEKIHQGSNKCKPRAKTCVFWSGINSNIDKIVQQCTIGQELQKSQSAVSLMPHEIPVRPWQIVATDIFNLNRHNYLLIVDYYSKYPFICKLREFSSKEVTDIKQIFAEQGVPERLISDNGPHFSSQQFKEFAKGWDFEHITSSLKYPQSNGMAEQCIQTVKAAMKKAILGNWDIDMSAVSPIDSNGSCNPIPGRTTIQSEAGQQSSHKMHQQKCPKRGNSGVPNP